MARKRATPAKAPAKAPQAGRRQPRAERIGPKAPLLTTIEIRYLEAYVQCAGCRVRAWYAMDSGHEGDNADVARQRSTALLASIRRKAPELLRGALEQIADLGRDLAEGDMVGLLMSEDSATRIRGIELAMKRYGWEAPQRVQVEGVDRLIEEARQLAEATALDGPEKT